MTTVSAPVVTFDGQQWPEMVTYDIITYRGRPSVDEQPRPGYATLVLTAAATDPRPERGQVVHIAVDGIDLWHGRVSTIATELDSPDRARITVGALGPLARMVRGRVRSFHGSQLDGDRIAALLADALAVTWDTYPDRTWTAAPDTWATLDGYDLSQVDQPGVYVLAETEAERAFDALVLAAHSGDGMLTETRTGLIGYHDSARRPAAVFDDIPGDLVIWPELAQLDDDANYANEITVTYSPDSEVTARDASAIRERGDVVHDEIATALTSLAAAQQRAERAVRVRRQALPVLDRVPVAVGLSDTPTDWYPLDPGDPVVLPALPLAFDPQGATYPGFVEAVEWHMTPGAHLALLTLSPAALSAYRPRWIDSPDGFTWADVDPSTIWTDLDTESPPPSWPQPQISVG